MVSLFSWILSALCISSISASATATEQRRHIRSIQAKDVWPKFIYQSISFNRNPSVGVVFRYCLEASGLSR